MAEFFTKENITFILGLIGSLGTAVTFIKSLINNRTNFSIKAVTFETAEKGILTYLMFINNSHKPITITSLSICVNGIFYPAILTPEEVRRTINTIGKEIVGAHYEYSTSFPIALTGEYSTSGYIFFPLPKGISVPSAKMFSLKVCTNRGTAVEKLLELNDVQ